MVRVPRRSVLRAACAAGAAATSGCVSLTAGGVGGAAPGTLIVRNRDDRVRSVDVCANPAAADAPAPRATVRVAAGASAVRDGFVATPGRYVVEVRPGGECGGGEPRSEAELTYERAETGALRGDAIEVTLGPGGTYAVAPVGVR